MGVGDYVVVWVSDKAEVDVWWLVSVVRSDCNVALSLVKPSPFVGMYDRSNWIRLEFVLCSVAQD